MRAPIAFRETLIGVTGAVAGVTATPSGSMELFVRMSLTLAG